MFLNVHICEGTLEYSTARILLLLKVNVSLGKRSVHIAVVVPPTIFDWAITAVNRDEKCKKNA